MTHFSRTPAWENDNQNRKAGKKAKSKAAFASTIVAPADATTIGHLPRPSESITLGAIQCTPCVPCVPWAKLRPSLALDLF
jgi:hypothetical protein